MKHTIILLFAAAAAICLCGASYAAECCGKCGQCYVQGEALVTIKMTDEEKAARSSREKFEKLVTEHAARTAKRAGAEVVEIMMDLSISSDKIFAHFRSDKLSTDELLARLEKCPDISAVQKNHVTPLSSIN